MILIFYPIKLIYFCTNSMFNFGFGSKDTTGLKFKCKLCTSYNYKILESTPNTIIINYDNRSQLNDKLNEGITKVSQVSDEYSKIIKQVVDSGYLDGNLSSFENIAFSNRMCEKILEMKTSDDKPFACINLDCIKL